SCGRTRVLPSFPTRRSSDLIVNPGVILAAGIWNEGSGSLFNKADKGLKYYSSGTVALVSVEDVVLIMMTLMKSDIKNERFVLVGDRKSTRLNSSHVKISYAV